ncbi:Sec-independent protein translocase protein TatB [Nitrosomonas sp.]|uniref:Sec-independent protein translocase protein TatB n=1 Tax=Nitrosomonas sp. TaxID=42353 RepID=UPI0025F9D6E1|nr:Sec-independent protein translocase protein TatB [Nitrosomonas sp.]MCC6916036.1 twin-arginine translocase subunit TatB [Nitrosomonas sp.]
MFDVSFAELIVIGIVALVVIGPERLPAVARTVGYFLGRARRYVDQVKRDLHEEMELDSLKKLKDSMHETIDSFENSVHSQISEIQETVGAQSVAKPEKQPQGEKSADSARLAGSKETTASPVPQEPRQPEN